MDEKDLLILILEGLRLRFNPYVYLLNRGDNSLVHTKFELLAYENLLMQQDKTEETQVY